MPPIDATFQRLSTVGSLPALGRSSCHGVGEQGHTASVQRVALAAFVVALVGACADPPVALPTAGEASDTLEIRCDGATTEVLTPIVQARMDGVHLVHENTSEHELLTQTDPQGDGVPPGETSLRLPILPGSARFRCLTLTDELDPGVGGGWARFDVLAPEGWVSPDVD